MTAAERPAKEFWIVSGLIAALQALFVGLVARGLATGGMQGPPLFIAAMLFAAALGGWVASLGLLLGQRWSESLFVVTAFAALIPMWFITGDNAFRFPADIAAGLASPTAFLAEAYARRARRKDWLSR